MEYSNLTDRSSLNEANTPSSQTTVENLPDIPADFPVPATGQSLKLVKRHDVGKRGRAVNLRVNHFAIQSLPIVKVRNARRKPSSQDTHIIRLINTMLFFQSHQALNDAVSRR